MVDIISSGARTFAHCGDPHTWFDAFETETERAERARVRKFAWSEFETRRDETDLNHNCNELMPVIGREGLIGTCVSGRYGGAGSSLVSSAIVAEELAGVVPSLAALRGVCGVFVGKPLETFGTSAQIDRYLPELLAGNITTALAITEPGAGSDVGAISTEAKKQDDGWILNGVKHYISGAIEARFMLVYALTSATTGGPQLTAFLVPREIDGVNVTQETLPMGVRGLSHARVEFDNVKVEDDARLGGLGQGQEVMAFGLAGERIDIAARALGCAKRAFEEARAFAGQREQFGKPIRSKQAVSHRIASMRSVIDAGRLLLLRAARKYDDVLASEGPLRASELCTEEAAMAKLFCAREGTRVCDDALQILGGVGYFEGAVVEALYRDIRVLRLGGGTDEIQRHIIQKAEFAKLDERRQKERPEVRDELG